MIQNRIEVMGRLVKDPELRKSKSGKSFVRAAIASWQSEDLTYFFDCVFFDKLAEQLCEKCKKGDNIFVVGKPQLNKYENKNGETVTGFNISVKEMQVIAAKGEGTQNKQAKQQTQRPARTALDDMPDYDDDLPF